MSEQLQFTYIIQKVGSGFQTSVPNLKNRSLILKSIELAVPEKRPELEVTVTHGGNTHKFGVSYFQIFDKINLADYWWKLTDGDRVELSIKNKSNQDLELPVTYTYGQSDGILINNSSFRASDLKESTILSDLSNGWQLTKLHIKSETPIKTLTLRPKFSCPVEDSELSDLETTYQMEVGEDETVLDFSSDDLAPIRSMLSFYALDIDFQDRDKRVYLLAYGFRA